MTGNSVLWIQRPDTSIEEVEEQTSQAAIKILHEYDWEKQGDIARKLGGKGVEPSFGMGDWGDDYYINIIPKKGAVADVIYARKKESSPRKLLGFIPLAAKPATEDVYREDVSYGDVEAIIHAYFENNAAKLARLMQVARDEQGG